MCVHVFECVCVLSVSVSVCVCVCVCLLLLAENLILHIYFICTSYVARERGNGLVGNYTRNQLSI